MKDRRRSEWRKFKQDRSEPNSRWDYSQTEGIDSSEIERRKAACEHLRCAWPAEWIGNYKVNDCVRLRKLDKGTASYPKAKEYQKIKVAGLKLWSNEEDNSRSESKSSDSEEEQCKDESSRVEESEGGYLDVEHEVE